MEERFLTEQERVDNMTMKMENESIQGSGFIQHPPQERRPRPQNFYNQNPNYRRRGNYGQGGRGPSYRPRQRPFRPRPPHQGSYYPARQFRPDNRGMYYHGQPHLGHTRPPPAMGRGGPHQFYGPPAHARPSGEHDWRFYQGNSPGQHLYMPGMAVPRPPVHYPMGQQMRGHVSQQFVHYEQTQPSPLRMPGMPHQTSAVQQNSRGDSLSAPYSAPQTTGTEVVAKQADSVAPVKQV